MSFITNHFDVIFHKDRYLFLCAETFYRKGKFVHREQMALRWHISQKYNVVSMSFFENRFDVRNALLHNAVPLFCIYPQ